MLYYSILSAGCKVDLLYSAYCLAFGVKLIVQCICFTEDGFGENLHNGNKL